MNKAILLSLFFCHNIMGKTIYVATTGSAGNNGLSWAAPKISIPTALAIAVEGDVILVKYGTYVLSSTIILSANVKITSDDGDGTGWDDAQPDSSQCILNGNDLYRVLQFTSSSTTNSLIVRGFKIWKGNATNNLNVGRWGGGISIRNGADPIIERCWITENRANRTMPTPAVLGILGGGIFIQDSEPVIRYNRIDNNYATYENNPGYGGGICIYNSSIKGGDPIIIGNYFANNVATYVVGSGFTSNGPSFGGGLSVSMSSPLIENNVFNNNWGFRRYISSGSTDSYACGGAVALDQSSSVIKKNTFMYNRAFYEDGGANGNGATGRGGALYLTSFNGSVENNVFYKNLAVHTGASSAFRYGNAINYISGTATVKNNIFFENNQLVEACILSTEINPLTINYNCFFNNYNNEFVTSNNEILFDPKFTNAAGNDFSLQSSSPCINAGDPLSVVEVGGEPVIDMGIKEFISLSSATYDAIDNSLSDNFIPGKSLSIASVDGTINTTIELVVSTPPNSSDKRNIGRYWDISCTGNAYIRLYFPTSAISAFTGNPVIFHYDGFTWGEILTTAVQSEGTASYVESVNPVTSWSFFTIGDSEDPLPVELKSFTASVAEGKIALNWQTATEVNNYGFEIERMLMGEESQWEKIGFVEGAGNSNSPKQYSFIDNKPATSTPLGYRLKQIDNDGKFIYSKEITVELSSVPEEFSLSQNYPNPFNPTTTIKYSVPVTLSPVTLSLKVFNLLGQEVATLVNQKQPAGNYKVKFDASQLSSGVYLYKIQAGEYSAVKKLILMK